MPNVLLTEAVHASPAASRRGILERLFTLWFRGFVYNQIWEDPAADLAAMEIGPDHRIVTIASGGCNILNYLLAGPGRITAIDLNPCHLAVTRMKLAAVRTLPDEEAFFTLFGRAESDEAVGLYDRFIASKLDGESRSFWEARAPIRGRRIDWFRHNFYRFGLLGRFIGIAHQIMRAAGKDPARILGATSLEEQRRIFESDIRPLFSSAFIRVLARMPTTVYGLGIPPAQFDALKDACAGDLAQLYRERVERLLCDFPIQDNYFAWQAMSRRYDTVQRRAVPPYLARGAFQTLRERIDRVETVNAKMTEYLGSQPNESVDRYVFLDAQDWMTDAQLIALWDEVTRTARPGARVIFRTAGAPSPLERVMPAELRALWDYDATESEGYFRQDRSSIYGGFHLYRLKAPC